MEEQEKQQGDGIDFTPEEMDRLEQLPGVVTGTDEFGFLTVHTTAGERLVCLYNGPVGDGAEPGPAFLEPAAMLLPPAEPMSATEEQKVSKLRAFAGMKKVIP